MYKNKTHLFRRTGFEPISVYTYSVTYCGKIDIEMYTDLNVVSCNRCLKIAKKERATMESIEERVKMLEEQVRNLITWVEHISNLRTINQPRLDELEEKVGKAIDVLQKVSAKVGGGSKNDIK